ncbi:hypothetical protein [Nannocystis radixulma]|uniref:Uncharacterized protein n=1 Tax=Nannocystis radixulma TaxID=2995305 RepID=A0ABT5BDB0_9BACT|nr:hypothetical protein [Nannocystis radixulma]MDC0671504.1 hypothetical protein [Nannocystis radixulma]
MVEAEVEQRVGEHVRHSSGAARFDQFTCSAPPEDTTTRPSSGHCRLSYTMRAW